MRRLSVDSRKRGAAAAVIAAACCAVAFAGEPPVPAAARAPLPLGDDSAEDVVTRAAALRAMLFQPSGRMPARFFSAARAWIDLHVPTGVPWTVAPLPSGERAAQQPATSVWTSLGPRPIDQATQQASNRYGHVTSRFNAVTADPRTLGSAGGITAYAGATGGGLWKSTNCCATSTTWTPLWDGLRAVPQSVGAVTLDPNAPDTIYVGTGDFDGHYQIGEGILKSTDAGQTWVPLGTDVFTSYAAGTPLWNEQSIGVVAVDPRNSSTVLAGTHYDLYVSHDAGTTWKRCPFGANPTDPTRATNPVRAINRITGIVFDTTSNPTMAFVAVGDDTITDITPGNGDNGVYSGAVPATGCPALSLLTTGSNGWPANTGNGTNGATTVGRIRLASSRGNATGNLVLYAQVQDTTDGSVLGTWVTTNRGSTWTQLAGGGKAAYKDCLGAATGGEVQDYYDLWIEADPSNDKVLYIGRASFYKAIVDAGYASMSITDVGSVYAPGCPGANSIHPDMHDMRWIGTAGATRLLVSSDGGVYASDGTIGGFTNLNGGIDAVELYGGQLSPNFASAATQFAWAGAQDNGTSDWVSSDPDLTWQGRVPSDGFEAEFDPLAGSLTAGKWFAMRPQGQFFRSTAGATGTFLPTSAPWSADRPFWRTPYRLDAQHCTASACNNVVLGAAHLYASVNGGGSWTEAGTTDLTKGAGSILSVAVAPSDPAVVAVGTQDGNVQWSGNVFGGANCTVAAANTASFACTVNAGAAWTNLTQGNAVLPNRFIANVAFDPTSSNRLYAAVSGFNEATPATPGHVFAATNNAGTWTWSNRSGNLPDIPVYAIAINPVNANQAFIGTLLGFFYTDNIGAAAPTWMRYPYSIPDTVLFTLEFDRGTAASPTSSTTLAGFTLGRGAWTIRLPGATGFPPHPVAPTMTAKRNGAGVDVAYDVANCPSANHNLYWGVLSHYAAITGGTCAIGSSGSATGVAVPANSWFVLAGTDDGGTAVSSFGTDSAGNPESFTGWPAVCPQTTQNTTATCP